MQYFMSDLQYLKIEVDRINKLSKYLYEEGITPKDVWYALEDVTKQLDVIMNKYKEEE